jgi:hypothetical protein
MTPKEFENYLIGLSEDEYDKLMQERIARLNDEQKTIAQAREVQRKQRAKLIAKLSDPNADEDVHHMVFNALRDMDGDECEHGRHYVKNCIACGEMDHAMFPELFDEDGFRIEDNE